MKVVAIVQARVGSTRLPNKVMMKINQIPMIEILLSRLSKSKEIDQIVVATSVDPRNISLINHVRSLGYACEIGSENNVLDRYVFTSRKHGASIIVRITGDCPLVDPQLVDECILKFKMSNVDYLCNRTPPTFPDGLDVEVFSSSALALASTSTNSAFDQEHVTPYIYMSGLFKLASLSNNENLSELRWTVDEIEDFYVISNIFNHFSTNIHFNWTQVLQLQRLNPLLFKSNYHIVRNQGSLMGTGQKLWQRAKRIIPGGSMLLSKRSEMFLPDLWPAYFSKAKGCNVWDLDDKKFTDMSIMGIGTNVLGYGHSDVDAAVLQTVQSGNMSTLNCPEEVYLAEKLISMHPWAEMARFARSGGEANAVAIRIARASAGRDNVAICGYHGWHDWYLAANLGSIENLEGHLLPGLDPKGVPQNLKGTIFTFTYNNFDELVDLVNNHDIGVIKMEVMRNVEPQDNFLHKVRQLATEKNIVLIFDECTSGFRETFGGLHIKYGIEPDIAMFGKTLGNGYAITAILGRRCIMEAAQSTFISSTFWTERIGPTAALKTLDVMEKLKSWDIITNIGKKIQAGWLNLANSHGLTIDLWGLPALAGFSFKSENSLAYKTLITQEMLENGFLAGNCVYSCINHTPEIIDSYFNALDPIFHLIKECEDGRKIDSLLKGPICHGGFKRLN